MALIVIRNEAKPSTSFSLASTMLVKALIDHVVCSEECSKGTLTLMLEQTPTKNVSEGEIFDEISNNNFFICLLGKAE